MAPFTLTHKRIIAAIYVTVLALSAGSYYLSWDLYGGADRKVLVVVTVLGVLMAAKWGPALVLELQEYQRQKRLR
jgi:hypothetical protein